MLKQKTRDKIFQDTLEAFADTFEKLMMGPIPDIDAPTIDEQCERVAIVIGTVRGIVDATEISHAIERRFDPVSKAAQSETCRYMLDVAKERQRATLEAHPPHQLEDGEE